MVDALVDGTCIGCCMVDVWYCWDQLSLPKFSSPLYFTNLFFPFLFPLLYVPSFLIFFSPSSFPFLVTILSHFSKTIVSRVGGLSNLNLHPYSHIMSLTDHRIILYLTIFAVAGSQVQYFIFQVARYPFFTQRYAIYIMIAKIMMGTELLNVSFILYPSLTNRSQHLAYFLTFTTTGW